MINDLVLPDFDVNIDGKEIMIMVNSAISNNETRWNINIHIQREIDLCLETQGFK